jgi:YHS domain-containing protein
MKLIVNADPHGRVALQGYDPVAFHAAGKPVKGDPAVLAEHQGFKYLFATKENKAAFEKEPARYLPAFGGFCAFGVSLGVLFPVEMDTWKIVGGRLVLQFNDKFKKIFGEDLEGNMRKADDKWKELTGA